MKKRLLRIFAFVSTGLTLAVSAMGFIVSNRLMYMKKKDENLILERETSAKRYDEVWYASVHKNERWIESENGYPIKAIFLEPHDTNRYVIICHGVTETKVNSFKYARMFERLGFNSVVYDHRRHGDSGGKTTSFGHYEKFDLKAVVEALKFHVGPDLFFGIHGESMGGATTLLYAGMDGTAAFYIIDCAYSDISKQILHVMKKSKPVWPSFALKLAAVFMKLRDGYSIAAVSPIEAAANIKSPVLFIHSLKDEFVLPEMSQEMYDVKPEPKAIKFFPEGAHAQSYNENSEEYEQTVTAFLRDNGLLASEIQKSTR